MTMFITLTAVDLDQEASERRATLSVAVDNTHRDVELDDLEMPVQDAEPSPEPVEVAAANPGDASPAARRGATFPVAINVSKIREFYPRSGTRVGTRIVFDNGAARPVSETFEEVLAALATAGF